MTAFDTYLAANDRMNRLIDLDPGNDRSVAAIRIRAIERFHWMRDFMAFLGDPQLSVPVIHVTGTSGKGSTATAVESILRASGVGTLLHTSPYLQVSTEKLQLDGRLISADLLAELTDDVIDAGNRFRPGELTYGEAWMALVFLAMRRFKPDVAIVEVGAGGRFDVSNVVQPDVAVITTVGIDHTESLGDSISEIAWHKAGIIKSGAKLVHSVSQPDAITIIDTEAATVGVRSTEHVRPVESTPGSLSWIDRQSGATFQNGIAGRAQIANGMLAVAAARAWRPEIATDALMTGLRIARIAARFEKLPGERNVILDGAHNEQKMAALVQDLESLPRPIVAVVGFLASKRFDAMIAALSPTVDALVITEPNVIGKDSANPDAIQGLVANRSGKPVVIAQSVPKALTVAQERAGSQGSTIVTGSLYLCGQAREYWYSSSAIVEQRTQWPG